MASLKPVRGTRDLLPEAMRAHRHVVERSREIVERYGFEEIATPIFEASDVFKRTLGDTSDIDLHYGIGGSQDLGEEHA